jgi:hypothetical protein
MLNHQAALFEKNISVSMAPEGKRPIGRPRPWWEDNIKMYFR